MGSTHYLQKNGEVLYSHICKSKDCAKDELIGNRPGRIKRCKKLYGTFKVLYLGDDDMTMDKLAELTDAFYKEVK